MKESLMLTKIKLTLNSFIVNDIHLSLFSNYNINEKVEN